MAGTTVDVGTGIAITYSSSFFAQITNVSWSGMSREAIETTHMGTAAAAGGKFGNKTFILADTSNPGTLTVDGHFNPETSPPIDSAFETVTVTWPLASGDSSAGKWACSGAMTDFSMSAALDDKMTFSATLQFSGNITKTAAS